MNNNMFSQDENYLEEIAPNVWLMDDHKWAFLVWWSFFSRNDYNVPVTLMHLDYHWDAVNDFQNDKSIQKLLRADYQGIWNLISEGYIRKDSFIAPAIIKGYVKQVHFYCKQYDNEIGFYQPFLEKYNAAQTDNQNLDFVQNIASQDSILFDFDLDLFNRSDMWSKGDLWHVDEIFDLIQKCSVAIKNALVITIAMSFGYSGTKQDTVELARQIIPRIITIRNNEWTIQL